MPSVLLLASLLSIITLLLAFRIYAILPRNSSFGSDARRHSSKQSSTRSLAVFLGSGGHTSEALMLLSSLDFDRYTPRTYIVSEGDILSATKAADLEARMLLQRQRLHQQPLQGSRDGHAEPTFAPTPSDLDYRILTVPRARKVHQPLWSTPVSAVVSLLVCIYHVIIAPRLPLAWSNSNRKEGQGDPAPTLAGTKKTPLATSKNTFADVLILNGPGTCFVLCLAVFLSKLLGLSSPTTIYVESFARVKTLSLSGKLLRPLVDRFLIQWPDVLQDSKRGEYRGWLI